MLSAIMLCCWLSTAVEAQVDVQPSAYTDGDKAQRVSFHRQIMPLLTRSGCNAGACHGAAVGRGGLHLSLFGSDPQEDYIALVHQLEGRRVHRLAPEKSLILRKPVGELPHGGDQVFEKDSLEYQTLATWVRQGALLDAPVPLRDFVVRTQRLSKAGEPVYQLQAWASFSSNSADHSSSDVTRITQFTVTDADSVELDVALGEVRLLRPGRHVVIARYLDRVQAITVSQAYANTVPASNSSVADNFIDREINRTLDELNLPSGRPVSDAVFLRRVNLDLAGRLPEPEEVLAFEASETIDKRERLVDRLLASPAFNDYWTLIFARWLRLHSLPNEPQCAEAFGNWLHQSIADGQSWSNMTRQMLTAQGDSHSIGSANFSRMVGDARAHAELVSDVFLGARLACANCHDHPLDRWTQDDYHGLAAMLARIDRSRHVRFTSRGDVTHPKTSSPARWRLPGESFVDESMNPTEQLASWLVGRNNLVGRNKRSAVTAAAPPNSTQTPPEPTQHAQAYTNRIWSEMFGRGLVEAVDDLRQTNPATHPELLNSLASRVTARDYDLRCLLRWIATSQAYARECVDHADPYYGYHQSRPLSAHVLADAIADVTGVPMVLDRMPLGTRCVRLLDPLAPSPALDLLGRCGRLASCSPSSNAPGLATQLHLINGELINRTLDDPNGRLMRLADRRSTEQIVKEFYVRAFSQLPRTEEVESWSARLRSEDKQERTQRLQDWLWSILSSQRFQRNH